MTEEALPPLDGATTALFATPLVVIDWPASESMNAELSRLIATARAKGASAEKSNVGGWHSQADFIRGDAAALTRLCRRIQLVAIELTRRFMAPGQHGFSIDGWANVLGPGHYNGPHNHPNAVWSGVYYLTGIPAGAPADAGTLAGKIEFFDPRPAATMLYAGENALQRRCLFTPRPGCMLVFPSWLQHMVHPHRGSGERQSIAFNVSIQ